MNYVKTYGIMAAALVCAASGALAEDGEAPKRELSVTIGGTYNDGNTEDKSGNASVEYKNVIEDVGEYKFGANGTITRTSVTRVSTDANGVTTTRKSEETTAKNGEVDGKVLFTIADPFSAYLDASVFADEIADVDYRAMVGAGVAVDLLKSDSATIRLEVGVAPMWEKIAGDMEYYTMGRVAETIEYSFAGGAKIWESAEYLPAFDDSDKYLANAEVGVESPLNGVLSLRFVVQDRYNSLPGEGNEKNDVCATVGIRIKL